MRIKCYLLFKIKYSFKTSCFLFVIKIKINKIFMINYLFFYRFITLLKNYNQLFIL